MGIHIRWLITGKVIHADLQGSLSIEELQEGSQIANNMIEESESPLIHILTNESQLESLPVSVKAFNEAVAFTRHSRLGWLIMYGTDNRFAKFMSSIVSGISRVRHRRFVTLEDALKFLAHVDTSLPSVEEMKQL